MPEQKERQQSEMAKSKRRLRRPFKTRKTKKKNGAKEEKPQAISQGGFPGQRRWEIEANGEKASNEQDDNVLVLCADLSVDFVFPFFFYSLFFKPFLFCFFLLRSFARRWRKFFGRCKLNFPIRNAHSFALFSSPSGFDSDFGRIQFSNFV